MGHSTRNNLLTLSSQLKTLASNSFKQKMGFFDNVWDDIKDGASKVEHFGENVVDKASDTFKWGVKQGENVIDKTEGNFTSIISLPLLLIAGGVAFFLYNSNAGQVAEVAKTVAPVAAL
jgi:hypothetical protein